LNRRCYQVLLIVSVVAFSWLAMQVVQELGHVLHVYLSGGTVLKVVAHPAAISRTDYTGSPSPRFVAWGGAIWGCLIPLAALIVVRLTARRFDYLAAWFAGFCLICNGAYLAAGSLSPGLDDAGVILRYGGPRWPLILFGLVAVPAGLWLLSGLGPKFGFGPARGEVDRRAAIGAAIGLAVLVIVEVAFNW